MEVDAVLEPTASSGRGGELETLGFGGAWVTETVRDPFLCLAAAAERTDRMRLATGVAIAFARSPMTLALSAHDLQRASSGRLVLGLGTQVRAHVTRRFSMPWSRPVARMREYVAALRAIWSCWNDGAELAFDGEFSTHTLMTPYFDPGPNGFGPPPVVLGGVGEAMTALAGEVADGFLAGPLTSPVSFARHTRPALAAGIRRRDPTMLDLRVQAMPLIVTGADAVATARVAAATRERTAFYASTPAYRDVLGAQGWESLHEQLLALSREQRWEEMGAAVDDEVLDAFAIVAEPDDVADLLLARWGAVADGVTLHSAGEVSDEVWATILGRLTRGVR